MTQLRNIVIFRGKKVDRYLFENVFWFKKFLKACKTLEQCKISELPHSSGCVMNMMFICKITEIKFCVSLREHHDVTFTENDAAAYTACLGLHRQLIVTAFVIKFSHTNLKIKYIQKRLNYKQMAYDRRYLAD